MKIIENIGYASVAIIGAVGLTAVAAFDWEPSNSTLGIAAFTALLYSATTKLFP